MQRHRELANAVAICASDEATKLIAYWMKKKGTPFVPRGTPGTRFHQLIEEKLAEAIWIYLNEKELVSEVKA